MTRYILIDNASGYIFGDTADYAADVTDEMTPVLAAKLLDEREVKQFGRAYIEHNHINAIAGKIGYQVYSANVGGSEAVPVVQDGQDQEMIAAVLNDCEFVCAIEVREPEADL